MGLFKPLPFGRSKNGQLQEVVCPRCKEVIDGEEISTYGDGVNVRTVRGIYKHICGYEVEIIEKYPIINRAPDEQGVN
jgi:phage FluMu protein Com